MPEVIEIKEYRDFISKKVKNKKLLKINILKGRYKKHGAFKKYTKIVKELPIYLKKVESKGKFMYMEFDKKINIGVTLGLTGGWFFKKKNSTKYIHGLNGARYIESDIEKYRNRALNHLNVEFVFENGTLYFYDQLSFGTITVFNENELEKKIRKLGIDIMDENLTYEDFKKALLKEKNKNIFIGIALMNQNDISGIGNYLRADALWMCKISPFRKVKDIKEKELEKLYHNVRILIWGQYNLKKGIQLKIISKKDKLPIDFKRNFFVYQKEKDIYNQTIIKEKLYSGSQIRYIYWVKSYQK